MTKIFNILINEDPHQMNLGMNTSLLYALTASAILEFEVNFFRVDDNPDFPKNIKSFFAIDKQIAKKLFIEYERQNQLIRDNAKFFKITTSYKVGDFLETNKLNKFVTEIIDSNLINNALAYPILNRVEPMKSPFPPAGNLDINIFLQKLIDHFPHIHAPINLHDKEIIPDLSTPTFEIKTSDLLSSNEKIAQKIIETINQYSKFYPAKKNYRVVIKPRDSAQSLGVCAIEFGENHITNSIAQINDKLQIYKIDKNVLSNKYLLIDIIKKVLENQCPVGKSIIDIYQNYILLQPYLEGIDIGDFRSIIIKNSQSNFEYCGSVFRKKINDKSVVDSFTTCATSGQSIPSACGLYQKSIEDFSLKIVNYLNAHKEKYFRVHTIGIDIIAKENFYGSDSKLYLGEMNMHCPALISMVEQNLSQVIDRIIKPQIELLNSNR